MASAKKEVEKLAFSDGTASLAENSDKVKRIVNMGILSSKVEIVEEDDDEKESKKEEKMIKAFRLSFFKVPFLYFEHLRRKNMNSFRVFLEEVYESGKHFSKTKMENEEFFRSVSIEIASLNDIYLAYCTKNGYKPRLIDEETKILEEYRMEVINKIDKSTVAYTNIRWKKQAEKENNEKRELNEDDLDDSTIKMFLEDECYPSKFSQDILIADDMKRRYEMWCNENNIANIKRVAIVGSEECKNFGAFLNDEISIQFVKGITKGKLPVTEIVVEPGKKPSQLGILRIPIESQKKIKPSKTA
jgi:hypothetical protein